MVLKSSVREAVISRTLQRLLMDSFPNVLARYLPHRRLKKPCGPNAISCTFFFHFAHVWF